jgi:Na+/H+ antiporter NhaD/arsenite permease-like protein
MLSDDVQRMLMWGIFGVTYVGIALGRFPRLVLDRTGIAILGGIGMLLVGGVSITEAAGHVDYETLLLLFGLMIFSAQLRVAGFYVMTGQFLTRLTDRPKLLLAGLIGVSGMLSALLANDIVCLAFTPLLCTALLSARRDPIPYLVALATSSNIGSAATLIGNPQNMFIGSVAGLRFGHFSMMMLPAALAGLALCWVAVVVVFHRRLESGPGPESGQPMAEEGDTLVPTSLPVQTAAPERDVYLIVKTLLLLSVLVVCFLFLHGEWRAIAALAGAGVLLCSRRAKASKLYHLVDWNLILLFLGLFVVNGAMQQQGLTAEAYEAMTAGGVDLRQPVVLSGVTLLLSNLVSNVPAVLLLEPFIAVYDSERLWYQLALISTWAGNLTLVGSIANLIVAEMAVAFGVRLDLKTYCKVGVPLTLLTVAAGTVWLMLVM